MTKTDARGRLRTAAPEIPAAKFDALLRQYYGVPRMVGLKIIVALRGRHRAALLRAVKAALARPAEEDFGAMPVSDELAGNHARALTQLGNVRPESGLRIIDALRWHPQAIIGALNDLLPVLADWQTEINRQGQSADPAGKHKENLQLLGVSNDNASARKPRHPLPKLPKGLRWPKDFDKAPESGRHPKKPGGIVAYLEREWAEIIAANKIDMPTLWEHFPKAAEAIKSFRKPHPETGERLTLPKKLTIPTITQVIDQKLAGVLAGKEVVDRQTFNRLSTVARWRAKNWPRPTP